MHSLHSYYNYYSNYTTTVSARCDCYYFRYWIPTSKFFLLAIILLFFPGLRQNSTFYLPSVVPSGKCNCTTSTRTSGTRTTVWERLVWTACTDIYIQNLFVIHQLCSSKFRSIADATCTCTAAVWLLLSLCHCGICSLDPCREHKERRLTLIKGGGGAGRPRGVGRLHWCGEKEDVSKIIEIANRAWRRGEIIPYTQHDSLWVGHWPTQMLCSTHVQL